MLKKAALLVVIAGGGCINVPSSQDEGDGFDSEGDSGGSTDADDDSSSSEDPKTPLDPGETKVSGNSEGTVTPDDPEGTTTPDHSGETTTSVDSGGTTTSESIPSVCTDSEMALFMACRQIASASVRYQHCLQACSDIISDPSESCHYGLCVRGCLEMYESEAAPCALNYPLCSELWESDVPAKTCHQLCGEGYYDCMDGIDCEDELDKSVCLDEQERCKEEC